MLIARFPRGLVSSLQSKFVGPLTGWFMLVPGGFSVTIPFRLHRPKADMLEKKKQLRYSTVTLESIPVPLHNFLRLQERSLDSMTF